MIYIQIEEERIPANLPTPAIQLAAEHTLAYTYAPADAELTIVLTDDAQLHELNLQYLGVDAPTDVLSFPADLIDPDSQAPYLGDILISVPRAQQQADAAGHRLQDELQLLVVHGVLHLQGHDHAGEEDKARMWAAQDAVLTQLGVAYRPA